MATGTDPATSWAAERTARLLTAARRIRTAAPGFAGHTGPDPATGETWERGQVLSHVAEMLPYWSGEVQRVVAAGGGGTAFGRVKSTPSRLARIESRRHDDVPDLLA